MLWAGMIAWAALLWAALIAAERRPSRERMGSLCRLGYEARMIAAGIVPCNPRHRCHK